MKPVLSEKVQLGYFETFFMNGVNEAFMEKICLEIFLILSERMKYKA